MNKELLQPPDQLINIPDYHDSPLLTYGSEMKIAGDPGTEDEFDTTLCYMEVIMDEFIQSGDLWKKTAADVADRLLYLNERHRYEVEQEHRTGETSTAYFAITIYQLRALSERQLRAMEETGWMETGAYGIALFFHKLVEKAATGYREMDKLLGITLPALYLSDTNEEDTGIPF